VPAIAPGPSNFASSLISSGVFPRLSNATTVAPPASGRPDIGIAFAREAVVDRAASAPYAAIAARFDSNFDGMEAKAPEDVTPVVAATDADPVLRYTAGVEAVHRLPPILQSLATLQKIGLHLTGQD